MKIQFATIKEWNKFIEYGDIKDIVKSSKTKERPDGFSRQTISAAVNGGDCTFDVFSVIQTFVNDKKQKIEDLINAGK